MDSDLPETWKQALAQKDAAASKPERRPIQPEFRFWPWGWVSMLVPLAGLALVTSCSRAAHLEFPSTLAGLAFYAILGFFQARIVARAIDPDEASWHYSARGAAVGAISVLALQLPGIAELSAAFLLALVAVRLVARLGLMSLLFVLFAVGTAGVFLTAVNQLMAGAVTDALVSDSIRLAVSLVLAFAVLNSILTASLPAEKGLFGRLDAAFAGALSSLQGLFAALVVYRTVHLALNFSAAFIPALTGDRVMLSAAAAALAVGNAVCVWRLFSMAYSARAERAADSNSEGRRIAGNRILTPFVESPLGTPRSEVLHEADIDDAT